MSRTLFKFTKPPDGLTRRVLFTTPPSWAELSAKVETLYKIPRELVGVSYVDVEGDEVTLSSDEELQELYKQEMYRPNPAFGSETPKAIKFAVRDITVSRESETSKPLPQTQTPQSTTYRNTFGTHAFPVIYDIAADDWQRVPSLGNDLFMSVGRDDDPHAFVEPIDSDVSVQGEGDKSNSTITPSDFDIIQDKGKGKARAETVLDDDISTVSMVAEHSPVKPPITFRNPSREDIFGASRKTPETAVVRSRTATPRPAAAAPDVNADAPDPPLPDLDALPNTPTASLSNDVANLFNSLSVIFASHPELSEGLRNIVQNARSGTYWNAHRVSLTRAAQEIRRSAQLSADDLLRAGEDARRVAEEAAGRRVAQAIENIIRTLSEITGGVPAPSAQPVTSTPVTQRNPVDYGRPFYRPGSTWSRESWGSFWMHPHPGSHHSRTWDPRDLDSYYHRGDPWHRPPFGHHRPEHPPPPPPPGVPHHPREHTPPPPPPPPRPPFARPSFTPGPPPRPGSRGPPPPPPPPPHGGMPPPGPPPNHGPFDWFGPPDRGGPPIPPPPPFGRGRERGTFPWDFETPRRAQDTSMEAGDMSMWGATPGDLDRQANTSRDRLEAAKEAYKAEKDRYRKERDDRRKERDMMRTSSGETENQPHHKSGLTRGTTVSATPGHPVSQLVSAARGPFPQLEMFSVPRRHNTMHGTGHNRSRETQQSSGNAGPSLNNTARTASAVQKRLADVSL